MAEMGQSRLLLQRDGVVLDSTAEEKLSAYVGLVRRWNEALSLVSQGDLAQLESRHVVDSLSLARYVAEGCAGGRFLLDLGSGGGFPAVPLAVALGIRVVMVERSERKAAFLRTQVRQLGVENAEVLCADFPGGVPEIDAGAVTARAIEKPKSVTRHILRRLKGNALYLCQWGDPTAEVGPMFHVERIVDAWSERGLRRGNLYLVTRGRESEA